MVPTTLTAIFFCRSVTAAVDFIRSLAMVATLVDVAISRSVPMMTSLSTLWGVTSVVMGLTSTLACDTYDGVATATE